MSIDTKQLCDDHQAERPFAQSGKDQLPLLMSLRRLEAAAPPQ
jgi:hypothetical protein